MVNQFILEDFIKEAIKEDLNNGDLTTDYLISDKSISRAVMTAKEDGIIAGLFVAKKVFEMIDDTIIFQLLVKDGEKVKKGQDIVKIKGKTGSILKAERLALNLLQRMSGIATMAGKFVELVEAYDVRIVDTRKTTPNLRFLEKAAVRLGGAMNHRYNLSDAVMIKDNHIKAAGSITNAVTKIRKNVPHTVKIEVEVQTLEQLKEALSADADIIMLDNMDNATRAEAVKITNNKAILEASGGINEETIVEVAKTGVDVISVGALTHSYKSLDISLNLV